jgi:hypothetical protein
MERVHQRPPCTSSIKGALKGMLVSLAGDCRILDTTERAAA